MRLTLIVVLCALVRVAWASACAPHPTTFVSQADILADVFIDCGELLVEPVPLSFEPHATFQFRVHNRSALMLETFLSNCGIALPSVGGAARERAGSAGRCDL